QTQFTVTVHDTKPPVIDPHPPIGPIEATGPSGAAVTYDAPAANDIVDGAVSVNCTPASGSTFALGVHPVSCSAPDAHGNSAASSFDVNVVDTTPPAISGVGPDLVIEATSGVGATVTYALPSATDLVDGAVAVTCAAPSGSVFALGVHTVNCNAQDAHSNSAGASFTVTVRDTTAPTIAGLFNLVIEATSPAGASASFNPTASDAVDPAVVVSCAPASGSTFALGTHTVACSATDFSDNTAQASFTVTVRDTTPPTIAPHAEVTITGASGSSALVHYTLPEAFDLVSGNVAVNCTPAPDSTFPVGTTAVNCSAADAAGNVATSSFPVTVHYAWTGFFRPIDNLPTVNSAKAGSAIPVKFSLGGNQGMAILAAGYPKSAPMACQGAVQDLVEETVTAGGSSLQYDAAANQYIYIWKTDKSWAGGCRQLQLRLADGTTQVANFTFTR
ncbi:MAG TPA: HYR domain-containing protein, partial [Lysobacter sp.]|nr:HYR domain-containing protein [Lysobacter sp.]